MATLLILAIAIAIACPCAFAINGNGRAPAPSVHLLVSLGQSNNQGEGCCYNASIDIAYSTMQQYVIADQYSDARYLPNITQVEWTLTRAQEPMWDGGDNRAHVIGSLVALGRLYSDFVNDPPVVLVQAAVSGTSITQWLAGGLLDRSIRATTNATTLAQGAPHVSMFTWVQGESDAGRTTAAYLNDLLTVIALARNSTPGASASTPFVLGSMVPEWTAATPTAWPIMEAHRMVPNLVPHTAYRQMPLGYVDCVEGIHFGASGQRLMATMLLDGYTAALHNDRSGRIPAHPVNLTVQSNGSVTLVSWRAPPPSAIFDAPIDGYEIRWKVYDRPAQLGPYPNCTDQSAAMPERVYVAANDTSVSIPFARLGRAGIWQFYVSSVSGRQISSGRFDSWVMVKVPQPPPSAAAQQHRQRQRQSTRREQRGQAMQKARESSE